MSLIVIAAILLTVLIYMCNLIKINIIKEIILYPVLVFSVVILIYIYRLEHLSLFETFIFIISALLGVGFHYFIMKKIDNSISKIDLYIYIYIYTLFQIPIILGIMGGENPIFILCLSLGGIFYLINIYCFYRFRRDKLLKIIIMPTVVSGLSFFLVFMIAITFQF